MIRATATFRPRSDAGRFTATHITPVVRMAVEESCALIQERAKALCPVDTGALRDSITTEIQELERTIRGVVSPHQYYAPYVEFGTGIRGAGSAGAGLGPYRMDWPGMVAQPYMRPAIDESREPIKDIFANDLKVAFQG